MGSPRELEPISIGPMSSAYSSISGRQGLHTSEHIPFVQIKLMHFGEIMRRDRTAVRVSQMFICIIVFDWLLHPNIRTKFWAGRFGDRGTGPLLFAGWDS
jgi:hypothetical protein